MARWKRKEGGREGGRGGRVRSTSGSKTPSLLPGRGLSRSHKERDGREGGSMSGRNARKPRREGGREERNTLTTYLRAVPRSTTWWRGARWHCWLEVGPTGDGLGRCCLKTNSRKKKNAEGERRASRPNQSPSAAAAVLV